MKGKKFLIILGIFIVVFLLAGGTFAYWNWETSDEQTTEIVFTLEKEFTCSADVGGDITPENVPLAPAACTDSKHAIKRELTVSPTLYVNSDVELDMWLDINSIDQELSTTTNFKYALTTSDNSCTDEVITSGDFYGQSDGGVINLLEDKIYTSTVSETYYLYIWLDAAETNIETTNKSFDFSLNGTCSNESVE